MLRATNSFRTDWVFVSIAITAVLSLSLFGLVSLARTIGAAVALSSAGALGGTVNKLSSEAWLGAGPGLLC